MEKFIFAFIIGGIICVIGQILMDTLKITPAHTTCTLVVIGAILGGFGLYDPLVKFAGAGATVPLTGFGYSLAKGVEKAVDSDGVFGILTGGLKGTAGGICAAILFGLISAFIFKGRTK